MSWRPLSELESAPIGGRLRALLGVAGSLTRTLREQCTGSFRLRLLGERPQRRGAARVREVVMLCGEIPWVFAQTVIPQETLAAHPWIGQLGETPLGDTLFGRPGVERGELCFGELAPGEQLYERAVAEAGLAHAPASLWARRSVIRIGERELAVNEVFLPDAGSCAAG